LTRAVLVPAATGRTPLAGGKKHTHLALTDETCILIHMDVGIIGGSGYGGAELLRLLAGHPTLKVRTVAANMAAGRDLAEVFPHLGMSGTLVPAEPDALDGCEVVFLATPHEASLALAPALLAQGATVVDLSGAFRLDAMTFEAWYGIAHTAAELTPAAYGLPELFRSHLRDAALVAVPGCYPTAALLALAPLAGLIDPGTIVVAGLSGTSGAGRGLREDLHVSHAVGNTVAYGAPRHRHTPEIERVWGLLTGTADPVPLTFVPHLVPMSRGQLCTVTAALASTAQAAEIRPAYERRYAAEPFVALLPEGSWPATTHLRGSNTAHLGVAVDERARRVVTSCALDNLTKGAAGQAIQAANVVLGLPETAGLPVSGVYP
jgi:N-acetyl-gamma-glutamyl-phosphate reductase